MLRAVTALVAVIIFSLLYYRAKKKADQRALEDAYAAQHGCKPMHRYTKGKWPLNLDLVLGLLRANQAGHILQYQGTFINALGQNFEQRILGDVGLVTLDPANVEAILGRQHFASFVFGQRRDAFLPQLGEGLFTQDGAPWKRSRELLRKQFARIHYSNNLSIFAEHVEQLIARMRALGCRDDAGAGAGAAAGEGHATAAAQGKTLDLMPLFFNFTLDTTTALLFGRSVRSLDEQSQDYFGANFDEASWISGLRVKLVHFYWLYSPPRYFRACRRVQKYADAYIAEALSTSTASKATGTTEANAKAEEQSADEEKYAFIKALHTDLASPSLVRDQLINVLLAGRDTTACLLSWTIRLLIRHPPVLATLQAEIRTVLGSGASAQDAEHKRQDQGEEETRITKEHIKRMPHLRAIIDETLRLYPSVPINVRTAAKPSLLPRGGGEDGASPVLVREGMGIGYAPYFMHRSPVFGPNAHAFDPQPWVDDPARKEKLGWAYLPFNGGPRRCLGEEFALLEAQYAVARIVQAFPGLRLPEGEDNVPVGEERQVLSMTLAPGDGCRVVLS